MIYDFPFFLNKKEEKQSQVQIQLELELEEIVPDSEKDEEKVTIIQVT